MESLTKTPGTVLGLIGTILGLIGTASATVISWRNAKRQAGSQAIDDLDQVRKALMEEIGRLSARVDKLEQENAELRAENTRLETRVSELEAELKSIRRV